MAHITDLVAPHFTGHVGLVRFVKGHAETDDPDLVAYFEGDPDRYQVTATDEPADSFLPDLLDAQQRTWDERHGDNPDDDPQE